MSNLFSPAVSTVSIASECPECAQAIVLSRHPKQHGLIRCPNCLEILVVVSTEPLQLDWALDHDEVPRGTSTQST